MNGTTWPDAKTALEIYKKSFQVLFFGHIVPLLTVYACKLTLTALLHILFLFLASTLQLFLY